jgi:UDP-N-acetylmuramoylalanine--D-glutamate ligase
VALAGGEAKQGDANSWILELKRQALAVVLFGAAQEQFKELLLAGGYTGTIRTAAGLDEAVPQAAELARTMGAQAVLLSPACASFDQYRDFEARGEHFRALVASLH